MIHNLSSYAPRHVSTAPLSFLAGWGRLIYLHACFTSLRIAFLPTPLRKQGLNAKFLCTLLCMAWRFEGLGVEHFTSAIRRWCCTRERRKHLEYRKSVDLALVCCLISACLCVHVG